ncbi:diguanylate cyclase (GGDEF) domain-containing protein [Terriglobus roseus DSM 18391]|uniref:Diguanylate cyclase (GGDEF) domain-containing protein n=1 Tax=Terriglobus roseus (strain DSM 18391 / NRRL B-41598 / KBS 63) TaxID=926566 RepID=I3ZLI6_TERRK|nr:bifunctional diguanylate cyclase/phosphodiesterase [Terriglobus roseus]AFL90104.1 diguanylate cyclase (GGDEF) domain-containing protein [Terriglobus roseus DSM 18391]
MDFLSPSFAGYNAARMLAMLVVPTLTAYTILELARQVQRSTGSRRGLWLGCGSLAVAMGVSCTIELSAGYRIGTSPIPSPDHLLQALCCCIGCILALFSLSRPKVPTGWVIASSLALAFGFTAVDDVSGLFRTHRDLAEYEASGLSFLVAAAASYLFLKIGALAKLQQMSSPVRKLGATMAMGLLMAGCLVFTFQTDKSVALVGTEDFLAGGFPLTALCLGTISVLVIALGATSVSRQTFLLTKELQSSLDQQRMRDVIVDQRVTRLQNEALLQEMQERQSAEGQLLFAAFHDSLTGLENRSSVSLKLEDLLPTRQRQQSRPWALLLNLDDLKGVNDLVGRCAGDMVLQEVAKRLARFTLEEDVLARVGGDEFLLLSKHIPTVEQALRKAHLMLSSVEEQIAAAGVVVNLSASIGLCEVGTSQHNSEDVFRDADTAVQVAKREGGGRCKLFVSTMRDDVLEAQRKKMELKSAVELKEFVLYYQPFVDMRDRSIYGVEALIRWNHPTKGLVGPGSFIPLAEETGQILAIGLWALHQACREFAVLQANSSRDLLVSVNVSPRQLFETPFLKILQDVLDDTGMPPSQLQLEITESIFIKDATSIGSLLHDIRALGVKVAFDDFGTGYSSLSYLTRYPIDTLKVDQSFVRAMNLSEGGTNLILFIVALAHEFKMSVTAEGVEEIEHESALLKQGCMHAQGYLYSRPVPLDAMISLLRTGLALSKAPKSMSATASRLLLVGGVAALPTP